MITLNEIISRKRTDVTKSKERLPLHELKKKCGVVPKTRDFKTAIKRTNGLRVIAEIKIKSPSEGDITATDPIRITEKYERSNASSISVLTDESFGGRLDRLLKVKEITTKPILRKDFIVDEYQIYESRVNGADAILLITSLLSDEELKRFVDLTMELEMECLVECHTREDIERIPNNVNIYGINNRDLTELDKPPDLNVTKNLVNYIPDGRVIVSESGIKSGEDIKFLATLDKRVDAILTGTAILRSEKGIIPFISEIQSADPV